MSLIITGMVCFTVLILALIVSNTLREQAEIRAKAMRDIEMRVRNAKN
jgi:hypothetical protein